MLGILYLFICFLAGYGIVTIAFPKWNKITNITYEGTPIYVLPYFFRVPVWFVIGTLVITWVTYLMAYIVHVFGFRVSYVEDTFLNGRYNALLYANIFVFILVIVAIIIIVKSKYNFFSKPELELKKCLTRGEILFFFLVSILVILLMWITFFIKDNELYVGVSVFSDFSPHIGMIRSFSSGNNYPTRYSHFTGEDIRYHFMFQFLVGNLEFLGLPIDYAFNIPSIISFISTFLLLYVLTIKITGKKAAGYLACLFFAFRSSNSLFQFLAKIEEGSSIIQTLKNNIEFIGFTPNEYWGLWNLNVYANQRHLPFSLCVMLIVLILMLPNLYGMFHQFKENKFSIVSFILQKEGWLVENPKESIAIGILLGLTAFWNGAGFIATIILLFFMAISSKNRLEYLIIAVIAGCLSLIQSNFFIKGNAIKPSFFFGFIAPNKTLFGVLDYIWELYGILCLCVIIGFVIFKGLKRYLIFVFLTPIIFAFTVSLTIDETVNHKYIMMAVMLLGIFVADIITRWFKVGDYILKIICVILCTILIGTGCYDFYTIYQKSNPEYAIVLDLEDGLTNWIMENTSAEDTFLTAHYALNQVVFGGAMLYYGWPYYAWSAGYDTDYRMNQVNLMYEADNKDTLIRLVNNNSIDFIIIDNDNRISKDYNLNEELISNIYAIVYEDGMDDNKRTVYDTKQLLIR